jgi:hypothetical protein
MAGELVLNLIAAPVLSVQSMGREINWRHYTTKRGFLTAATGIVLSIYFIRKYRHLNKIG